MLRKILLALASLAALFIVYQIVTFPRLGKLATENPSTSAFIEARRSSLRAAGKNDEVQHVWVPYDQISPHLRSAVLVSEDSRFYEHRGVDTEELEKILREAWKKKELGRGGSTITQQLVKNLYLSPSRNPWRKVKEILIAKRMEQVLDKKRILELYLNLVEFGERVYGAEAAARYYFGKSAASLTPSEAALLAGALPNPRKMNPGNPGPYLRNRRELILSRMRRWGYMADESLWVPRAPNPSGSEAAAETTTPASPMDEPSEQTGKEPAEPGPSSSDEVVPTDTGSDQLE